MSRKQNKAVLFVLFSRNLHDGGRCVKLFYRLIWYQHFSTRGPKNVLINAVRRPDVGRSCLQNVGANNVARTLYRENRKSQKAIAIKNARRGSCVRENCRVIRGARSSILLVDCAGINRHTIDVPYSITRFSLSHPEFIIDMANRQNALRK